MIKCDIINYNINYIYLQWLGIISIRFVLTLLFSIIMFRVID